MPEAHSWEEASPGCLASDPYISILSPCHLTPANTPTRTQNHAWHTDGLGDPLRDGS